MELKNIQGKLREFTTKYRYTILVFVIGLGLLLFPSKQQNIKEVTKESNIIVDNFEISNEELTAILQSIQGAGKVQVLLSIAKGKEVHYQEDSTKTTGDNGSVQVKTILVTDAERNQTGLIKQTISPIYQGAIVVCEGADSPVVKLEITQAVSKITGLGTDAICVLKMNHAGGL